jgi:hypothetical protein
MKRLFSQQLCRRCSLVGILLLSAFGALLPSFAFAAPAGQQPKCPANDVKCVITYTNGQITDRQNTLKQFSDLVASSLSKSEITPTQASTLQTDAATNQGYLVTLKAKVDAETVQANARQDLNYLWTNVRILSVVLPRDYRTLELDYEINAETTMQTISPVIKDALPLVSATEQKQMNALYSDYASQLANAQPEIQTAGTAMPALTVNNFNNAYSSLWQPGKTAIDQALPLASTDLHTAASDLEQMANLVGVAI